MIIYFTDRTMNILGAATTGLPEGMRIREDTKEENVDSGIATFACKIAYTKDTRELAESCTAPGNYILRKSDDENEFYTIIEFELDTEAQTIYIYAEDAGLDLLNEVCTEYSDDTEYSLAEFIEMWTYDSGFEIGVDESDSSVTMAITGREEETATERLLYIVGEFGYEIGFSFSIRNMQVTHKYIDIYEERGKDVGALLKLNRDVSKLTITKSVANLATALLVTGGTPDNTDIPVTLEGYEYDDGDFYVDGHKLKSRNALAKWSRYVNPDEPNQIDNVGHIVRTFTSDTTDQEELLKQAIEELESICDTEVNYECEISHLPDGIKIGDRVNLVDEDGKLYLSTRILKLSTSIVDNTRTATLGEFLIKDSGISAQVQELANQFALLAESRTFYTWIAYADDAEGNGISLDSTDKTYVGLSANHLTSTVDISDASIFTWSLINGKGVEEVTYYYGVSDTSTEMPTEWSTETPSTDSNNAYIWTYTETTYTDNTSTTTTPYVVTYYGFLKVDELSASIAEIEEAYILKADINTLLADYITTTQLEAQVADINTLLADYATIDTLDALTIRVGDLEADHITTEYLDATYASVNDLDAVTAKVNTLEANMITAETADLKYATIETLEATYATIDELDAAKARIDTLEAGQITTEYLDATYATITELDAATGRITSLEATALTAETADLKYANIELSNVSTESVGTLMVESGLLTDATITDASITGTLASVTINADTITTGTLSVDRLLITGEDGLIYEINATSAGLTEAELTDEVYQNYINGTVLVAESITADQIAASTITGDKITTNTITASHLVANTITANEIASGTITATEIASGTITGDLISSETITGDKLVANTITAEQIASNAITSDEIASNTITADNIKAGSITGTEIAASTITATNIASGTITAEKIDVEDLESNLVRVGDTSGKFIQINDDSLDIWDNETLMASFGTPTTIGAVDNKHVTIDTETVDIMDGTTTLASFGETVTIGQQFQSHITQTDSNFSIVDNDDVEYFFVGDKRFAYPEEQTEGEVFTTSGVQKDSDGNYYVILSKAPEGISSVQQNNTSISYKWDGFSTTLYLTGYNATSGYDVEVSYIIYTSVYCYTLGTRNDGDYGAYSTVMGYNCEASGKYAIAEGNKTTASGGSSHAEGGGTTASGNGSHAEGNSTTASGSYSHAEGGGTTASGNGSHAEGSGSTASASYSHAEGSSTTASGTYSHAEGRNTTASGNYSSHAEGYYCEASGTYGAHAEGRYTLASGTAQHVFGKYNEEDEKSTYAEIVGNGTSTSARSNARTLDWDGNEVLAGGLTATGNITTDARLYAYALELSYSTPYIDFHYNNSTDDYTSRLIDNANGFNIISNENLLIHPKTTLSTSSTGIALKYSIDSSGTSSATSSTNVVLSIGVDTTSPYLRSYATYSRTSSSSANVGITSAGTFYRYSSSSARYKRDITALTNIDNATQDNARKWDSMDYNAAIVSDDADELNDYALNALSLLKVPISTYHYQDGYITGEKEFDYDIPIMGFVAEDVAKVCPDCVTYLTEPVYETDDEGNYVLDADGNKKVAYERQSDVVENWSERQMIPRMLYIIQYQNERINELTESINDLIQKVGTKQ